MAGWKASSFFEQCYWDLKAEPGRMVGGCIDSDLGIQRLRSVLDQLCPKDITLVSSLVMIDLPRSRDLSTLICRHTIPNKYYT